MRCETCNAVITDTNVILSRGTRNPMLNITIEFVNTL
jgi:hypothetical protein